MQINTVSRESVRLHSSAGDLDRVYDALFGTPLAALSESASMTIDVKLELASAYIYLGDFDSARELLESAQREGSDSQSARAQSTLLALPLALS